MTRVRHNCKHCGKFFWSSTHNSKQALFCPGSKERTSCRVLKWRALHEPEIEMWRKAYYVANKGAFIENAKRWKRLNPAKYKQYARPSKLRYQRRKVTNLHDNYVRGLLTVGSGLAKSDLPAELVALKREQLQFKRIIRQIK